MAMNDSAQALDVGSGDERLLRLAHRYEPYEESQLTPKTGCSQYARRDPFLCLFT